MVMTFLWYHLSLIVHSKNIEVIPDSSPQGHSILLPLVSGVWTISWIIYWPHWVNIWFTLAFVLPSIWLRKLDTFRAEGRSTPFLFELLQNLTWIRHAESIRFNLVQFLLTIFLGVNSGSLKSDYWRWSLDSVSTSIL